MTYNSLKLNTLKLNTLKLNTLKLNTFKRLMPKIHICKDKFVKVYWWEFVQKIEDENSSKKFSAEMTFIKSISG
jgi:hypothetical protein